MVLMFRSWLQQIKQRRVAIGVVGIALAVSIALIIAGYWFDWTGFDGYTQVTIAHTTSGPSAGTVVRTEVYQPGKALWDWLQLLIIPAVLVVGGFLLNYTTGRNEQKSTQLRDQTERDVALDNQREAALQAYIDSMSELLLEKKLRESKPEDEVRKIARVRTLTVLPRLDKDRKRSALNFLYESGLINVDKQVISLVGADLSEANLLTTNLAEANLSGVNLQGALLIGAKLNGANLSKAVLSKASLVRVNLSGANLSKADLSEADLVGVDLSRASLKEANLSETNFSKTMHKENITNAQISTFLHHLTFIGDLESAKVVKLSDTNGNLILTFGNGANLSEADLSEAILLGANLNRADLIGANLYKAILYEADLSEANLRGAKVTDEQLKQAKSLEGATMPNGTKYA